MRDVVYEWYVPYVPSRKQMLLKAVSLSAAAVLLLDAVFFALLMVFPALICAGAHLFLRLTLEYEYEYVYVNGDFTVSKIIRKAKRRDVFHINRPEIEAFTEGRKKLPGKPARDFTSSLPNAPVYTLEAKGELVYIEPSEEFINEMKSHR